MDVLAAVMILMIGLLILGAAAAAFGSDTRDGVHDDHRLALKPIS